MKKFSFLVLLTTMLMITYGGFCEEVPPLENKDPAITENFRQIYYLVDQQGNAFIQNNASPSNSTQVFNVSSGTVSGNFYLGVNGGIGSGSGSPSQAVPIDIIRDGNDSLFGRIRNTKNTTTSQHAFFILQADQTNSDAYTRYTDGTTPWTVGYDGSDSSKFKIGQDNEVGVVDTFIITPSGEITQPIQPSFYARNNATQTDVTGDATAVTVAFSDEIFDQGSDFASNVFTAPVTGRYFLSSYVNLSEILVGHSYKYITIVCSNHNIESLYQASLAETYHSLGVSGIVDMDAGDTAYVTVTVGGSTKTVDVTSSSNEVFFSGSLIN